MQKLFAARRFAQQHHFAKSALFQNQLCKNKQQLINSLNQSQLRFKKSKPSKIEAVSDAEFEEAGQQGLEVEERAISIVYANKQGQLTSASPESGLPNSSNVPYAIFPRTVDTDIMFSELQQIPLEEGSAEFEKCNIVFLTHVTSKHNEQLAPAAPKQEERKGPKATLSQEAKDAQRDLAEYLETVKKDIGHNISFSIGLSDMELLTLFRKAGKRFPPRSVFAAEVQRIPNESTIFTKLWKDHFQQHPHVAVGVKQKDVNMFRIANVKSAYFVDISGEMINIDPVSKFTTASADAISPSMRLLISRLNRDEELLEKICNNGYNLQLAEKFVFSIDRFGMSLLGREGAWIPKKQRKKVMQELQEPENISPDAWAMYYLDFGEEITNEAKLRDFLLTFHEQQQNME